MPKSLNDITEQELEEVKRFAALFFTPKEIAMIMEFDIVKFMTACTIEGDKCFNAFNGGRLLSEAELRTSIVVLAKSGSSPAQTSALDLLSKSTIKMMDK